MTVFRITYPEFTKLTASGKAARWNKEGEFVIYSAENIALACLENAVHRSGEGLVGSFRLLTIEIPKKVSIHNISIVNLPIEWTSRRNFDICQDISTSWLNTLKTCVLSVPSVIIPLEKNYLINPQHPDFKYIKLLSVEEFTFDNRIKSI
jgi:RES domain-containing protein